MFQGFAFFPKPAKKQHAHPKKLQDGMSPAPMGNNVVRIFKHDYQLDRKLGNGWFGDVYAGRRLPDGKPVAVKVAPLTMRDVWKSNENRKAFIREIDLGRRLSRTKNNVVHVYDFDFDDNGNTYLVLELGRQDLGKTLTAKGALISAAERKGMWRQLVGIAMTLYNEKIAHLDIKPDNLIVFHDGSIKLSDLGIARRANRETVGGTGSPPFSAPEVTMLPPGMKIVATRKSDVWSWGALLYYLTYATSPNPQYMPPCDHPPMGMLPSSDPKLLDVLHHTLVVDPNYRPETPWLAQHPYTIT